MQRWALVRDGLVRGYLLHPAPATEQDEDLLEDAQRRVAFGPDDDDEPPMSDAGEWRLVPESAGLVGDEWTFDGTTYSPPVRS